jgi:hypothetical protein
MTSEQFEREARYQNACLLVENLFENGLLTAEESRNLAQYFEKKYQPIIGHLLLAIYPL